MSQRGVRVGVGHKGQVPAHDVQERVLRRGIEVIEQTLGPLEPPAGDGQVAAVHVIGREPARHARSADRVVLFAVCLVSALPRRDGGRVVQAPPGGGAEPLERLRRGRLRDRLFEGGTGLLPRPT